MLPLVLKVSPPYREEVFYLSKIVSGVLPNQMKNMIGKLTLKRMIRLCVKLKFDQQVGRSRPMNLATFS